MIERDWSKPLGLELLDYQPELDLSRPVTAHFKGAGVVTVQDEERLGKFYDRILNLMKDGKWRTVEEIQAVIHARDDTITRMLRYMNDPLVGGHTKNRRLRGPGGGLYEYQIILNPRVAEQEARAFYHAKHPNSPDPLKG